MPIYQKNSCPICKTTSYKELGKPEKGNKKIAIPDNSRIVICTECNLIYVNPMPVWLSDDFSILYDDSYFDTLQNDPKWIDIRENENIIARHKRIKNHLTAKSNRLLEVGSGIFAFMSQYLSKKNWDVTAQEPSESFYKTLTSSHKNIKTTNLPFLEMDENQKYSLIYSDSVFEHVADPLAYITKSARLLENGGILYFISPNEYSFINLILSFCNKIKKGTVHCLSPYVFPYHLIGFSKRSLEISAKKSGLELIQYLRRKDYYWFHVLKKVKNPLKYPASVILYVMDLIGFGANLEIILKKRG